jgi:hypothetical protein
VLQHKAESYRRTAKPEKERRLGATLYDNFRMPVELMVLDSEGHLVKRLALNDLLSHCSAKKLSGDEEVAHFINFLQKTTHPTPGKKQNSRQP